MLTVVSNNKTTSTPYMDERMKADFLSILLQMRESTIASIKGRPLEQEQENLSDQTDIATMQELAHMDIRQRERDTRMLSKIKASLKKLAEGDYGYCEQCGNEIGEGRLHARPTADLCIDCKQASEHSETQYAKRRAA